MKVAIRADASPAMGSGHIMRSLCLAEVLQARGAVIVFLCRPLPSHLSDAITAAGHSLRTLELPAIDDAPQNCWPTAQQLEDAQIARAALFGFDADWIVADHYGLGNDWERAMRGVSQRLMVIDDLARTHDCDLILDTSCHPLPQQRYEGRLSSHTCQLFGPRFALLRDEFLRWRKEMSPRSGHVHRILVFMGGMDSGNATGLALEALSISVPRTMAIDVVIGSAHPAHTAIEEFCAAWPNATFHVQTKTMSMLLARCDLAIGAGGNATWERCCLGVPTIALALADNQYTLLAPAARAGLVYVPDGTLPEAKRLAAHLRALIDNTALRESLSVAGMELVDGRGAQRVAAAMAAGLVRIRLAAKQDSACILAWRNAPQVREMSLDDSEISTASHERWFDQMLKADDHALLIGEDDKGPVGVVRFDLSNGEATVSIYLAQERHGQGLGSGLLRAAETWLIAHRPDIKMIHAQVLATNTASLHLFEQGDYKQKSHRFSKKLQHELQRPHRPVVSLL